MNEATDRSTRERLIDEFTTVLSEAEDMLKQRGERNRRKGARPALAGRVEPAARQAAPAGVARHGGRQRQGRGARDRRLRARQSVAGGGRRRRRRLPRRPRRKPPLAGTARRGRRFARQPAGRARAPRRGRACAAAHARRARRARILRATRPGAHAARAARHRGIRPCLCRDGGDRARRRLLLGQLPDRGARRRHAVLRHRRRRGALALQRAPAHRSAAVRGDAGRARARPGAGSPNACGATSERREARPRSPTARRC